MGFLVGIHRALVEIAKQEVHFELGEGVAEGGDGNGQGEGEGGSPGVHELAHAL